MKFEFATASRIIFGAGIASHLNAHVRDFGTRAFVITGSAPRHAAVLDSLTALTTAMFAVSSYNRKLWMDR